jgi:hypothetical protein
MITVLEEEVQPEFEIVHRKVLFPAPRPVTVEAGLEGVVIVPAPLTRLQVPLPIVGVFPVSVAEVPQTLWLFPASDVVGAKLIVRLEPLSVPVVAGLLPITLILYEVPAADGSPTELTIVPAAVDVNVPIVVGEANEPEASDSWAVKIFPEVNVPLMV